MALASYIGGQWQTGRGTGTALVNPTTGETVETASTDGLDLGLALAFARDTGGPALRALSYIERGGLLRQVADTLTANRDRYVEIAQINSGNTLVDAAIDIDGAIGTLKVYAGLGKQLGEATYLTDGDLVRLGRQETSKVSTSRCQEPAPPSTSTPSTFPPGGFGRKPPSRYWPARLWWQSPPPRRLGCR